jgi:hypothetical protein
MRIAVLWMLQTALAGYWRIGPNGYMMVDRIQVWKVTSTSQGMYGPGLMTALGACSPVPQTAF